MASMAAASVAETSPGDVAHAVGTLHDGDSPFRQDAAMPLLERQGFQLHDQSQQAHLRLFRRPGLGGGDGLLAQGGQGGGLGGPPRDAIDDPDLLASNSPRRNASHTVGIHVASRRLRAIRQRT